MKSKILWLVIIALIILAIFTKCTFKQEDDTNFNPINITVGQEFKYSDYPEKMLVLNYEILDFTGDKKKDMVILVGQKDEVTSTFAKNIDVVIYDGANKTFLKANFKKLEGHTVNIIPADFTGDKISDVLIVLDIDGACMNYNARVLTYSDKSLNEIYKERDNRGLTFTGYFEDGFKAKIVSRKLNKEITVDLQDRKENYILKKFYDDAGRLLVAEVKLSTEPFGSIEKVELNDRFGIRVVQKIVGFDELDIIDEVQSIWKYENGKWQIKEVKGDKLGNLLY
jgi:hypothetical protein